MSDEMICKRCGEPLVLSPLAVPTCLRCQRVSHRAVVARVQQRVQHENETMGALGVRISTVSADE